MDGISEKEVERELNDKDDPFVGLDDIEQDSIQTFQADLAFLKERLGDHVNPNITLDEYRQNPPDMTPVYNSPQVYAPQICNPFNIPNISLTRICDPRK